MEKAITPPLVVENTTPFVPFSLTLWMPGKLKRLAEWKRLLASRAGLWLARIRVAGRGEVVVSVRGQGCCRHNWCRPGAPAGRPALPWTSTSQRAGVGL